MSKISAYPDGTAVEAGDWLVVARGAGTVKLDAAAFTGPAGADGADGAAGAQGEQGIQGAPGNDGADGADGAAGAQGEQGIQGVKGDTGDTGPAGADGGSMTFDQIYPVGHVYISVVNTSPATLFGVGTWAAFGAGRMLIGRDAGDTDFDTAEETGGAKTSSAVVNHTHAVNVSDSGHSHGLDRFPTTTGGSSGFTADTSMSGTPTAVTQATQSAATGITATTDNPAGGVASFSIMNPYIVVYMWKRTA